MLGNTPMIGQNDSPGEIFTLADASTVESYAAQQGIALALLLGRGPRQRRLPGRDRARRPPAAASASRNGAFTQAFQPFTSGGSSGGGGGSPTPTPTPTPTSTRPARARRPGSAITAYASGNEVSYNGDNWTANQWNYDEVPGGPSGAWNNDGAC